MSREVCKSAFIRFAVVMWSASVTFLGRLNLVPFAQCPRRSLADRG
jgi:hypothetical protein